MTFRGQRIHNHHRGLLVVAAAIVVVAGNGMCMVMTSYEETLWLRFIAGAGSGTFTAVAVATLAGTSKPARAFNILLFSTNIGFFS